MGVPHVERNISRDPAAKRDFIDSGYPFLPAIEVGNSVITEYEGESQLIEVLVAEKYL